MSDEALSDSDHVELVRLVTELAWRIDHSRADTAHELFTDDATFALSGEPMVGRGSIAAWGRDRANSGRRTRHVCTNMLFRPDGHDAAEGTTIMTVYLAEAGAPTPPRPIAVGEYHDTFVRTDAGWRFRSRDTEILFSDG